MLPKASKFQIILQLVAKSYQNNIIFSNCTEYLNLFKNKLLQYYYYYYYLSVLVRHFILFCLETGKEN